jgi:hypothetical protein
VSELHTDPIQRYLGELRRALSAPLPTCVPRGRRLLQEAEAHLREAADREQAAGVSGPVAAHRAIDRFGSPTEVAAAAKAERPRVPLGVTAAVVSVLALGVGVARRDAPPPPTAPRTCPAPHVDRVRAATLRTQACPRTPADPRTPSRR